METLALLELLDRDGVARRCLKVSQWPVSLGRDVRCDLVLDDIHVAPEHVQIAMQSTDGDGAPERLQLRVGDSINGVQFHGRQLRAGESAGLESGDEWQMGRTRVRLRLASAAMAPEQSLRTSNTVPTWSVLLVGVASLLWMAGESYIRSEPDAFTSRFVREVVTMGVALSIWVALWSLATKLFQHRLEFWRHARLVMLVMLSAQALGLMLSLLAYASSLEWLGRLDGLVLSVLLSGLIYAHLLLVQPLRRKALRWFAGGLCALLLAGSLGMNWYRFERLHAELYLAALFPHSLRFSPSVSVDRFLEDVAALEPVLERKASEPPPGSERRQTAADQD